METKIKGKTENKIRFKKHRVKKERLPEAMNCLPSGDDRTEPCSLANSPWLRETGD
jgi:hypothetical protein